MNVCKLTLLKIYILRMFFWNQCYTDRWIRDFLVGKSEPVQMVYAVFFSSMRAILYRFDIWALFLADLSDLLWVIICVAPQNEGDWTCPQCGNVNFAFRTNCNLRKCNAPKPSYPTQVHYLTSCIICCSCEGKPFLFYASLFISEWHPWIHQFTSRWRRRFTWVRRVPPHNRCPLGWQQPMECQ